MDITEAIRRAEQWRKTDACSTSAKVAVALLNELERLAATQVPPAYRVNVAFPGDMPRFEGVYSAEQLRGVRAQEALRQAQSKANDDMLAAQRNLLLREDGYPNAPVPRTFVGPAHKSAVAIREQWFKPILGE